MGWEVVRMYNFSRRGEDRNSGEIIEIGTAFGMEDELRSYDKLTLSLVLENSGSFRRQHMSLSQEVG